MLVTIRILFMTPHRTGYNSWNKCHETTHFATNTVTVKDVSYLFSLLCWWNGLIAASLAKIPAARLSSIKMGSVRLWKNQINRYLWDVKSSEILLWYSSDFLLSFCAFFSWESLKVIMTMELWKTATIVTRRRTPKFFAFLLRYVSCLGLLSWRHFGGTSELSEALMTNIKDFWNYKDY